MLDQIEGLHHVTTMASDARANNRFFTDALGLRRVKKTVNFDAPDVYHLYFGDAAGTPGTVMTSFPFPNAARGTHGTGEVGTIRFAIPPGSAGDWADRLALKGVGKIGRDDLFGAPALRLAGPDGEDLALVETEDDRSPWTQGGVGDDMAIRGFHSALLRLDPQSAGAATELLGFMGYGQEDRAGDITRMRLGNGNGASVIDVQARAGAAARQGAGSVHHIAFGVRDRARQLEVRRALLDTGYQVTPPIDRDYFWAIYLRIPGGILFEVATAEPGFDRDEEAAHLGEALKLPGRHEHLRARLERSLQPIGD